MELIRFAKEYIVSPKHVGAWAPSSKLLAEAITEAARVRDANTVVEFGPGTGAFTDLISSKLKKDATFFAIEISKDFVGALQETHPGVTVFHDSAVNVRAYLDQLGLPYCDCIISGLPFALFEDELQDAVLDAALDALRPGGLFVTFTYFLSPYMPRGRKFKARLTKRFSEVNKTPIVWRNFLPAFAYWAVKHE